MRNFQRRTKQRDDMSQVVFYLRGEEGSLDERFFAVTVNVSDNGLCVFTDRPVSKGEVYLVRSNLWPSVKSAKAVWSNKLGDSLFETGFSLC